MIIVQNTGDYEVKTKLTYILITLTKKPVNILILYRIKICKFFTLKKMINFTASRMFLQKNYILWFSTVP